MSMNQSALVVVLALAVVAECYFCARISDTFRNVMTGIILVLVLAGVACIAMAGIRV
jgi:hypothetical protein